MNTIDTRRHFLGAGLAGIAGLGLGTACTGPLTRIGTATAARNLDVEKVETVTVKIPYRPAPNRAMSRELPHWRYVEIFKVFLRSGKVGIGETLLYYTWGVSNADHIKRVLGKNAADHMWNDGLGAGLQAALFDAVAQTLEVPLYRLLGRKVHDKTPLSWWNIDMSVEDMAAECKEALDTGYLSYKTKGRPWFDIWKQVDTAAGMVPDTFKIDMDFNDTLLTAERGMKIIKDLEKYPQVDIYETPIPQGDIEGNRKIREATRVHIAMHYGNPAPKVAVREGVCDGFVIGGGASRVMHQGGFATEAGLPFWLQLVGTGVTAAYSLHFGAVLGQARWPAVNCHQLYTHSMLSKEVEVKDGFAGIPEGPGLGYKLDEAAIEKFRVEKPARRPDPPRLIETSWPDGRRMYIANNGQVNFMLRPGQKGELPYYEPGVDTRLAEDDGSKEWKRLYSEARKGPYLTKA